MMKLKLFIVIGAIAAAVACSQATSNTPNTASTNTNSAKSATPAASPSVEAASGAKLYSTNCAKCHKEDGTGGKITVDGKTINPDNLTGAKLAAKPDAKYVQYITDGFPEDGMPAFKDKLSEQEIKDIIGYVRSEFQKTPPNPAPANVK